MEPAALHILIIDDDREKARYVQSFSEIFFKEHYPGIAVVYAQARSTEEAKKLVGEAFDLIFCDVELQHDDPSSGLSIVKQCRAGGPNQSTTIIGQSSNGNYKQRMMEAGCDNFVEMTYTIKNNPLAAVACALSEFMQSRQTGFQRKLAGESQMGRGLV